MARNWRQNSSQREGAETSQENSNTDSPSLQEAATQMDGTWCSYHCWGSPLPRNKPGYMKLEQNTYMILYTVYLISYMIISYNKIIDIIYAIHDIIYTYKSIIYDSILSHTIFKLKSILIWYHIYYLWFHIHKSVSLCDIVYDSILYSNWNQYLHWHVWYHIKDIITHDISAG